MQKQTFPTIGVTGFNGLANSPLIADVGHTYVMQSNLSQQRGKHLLKVGADVRILFGNFFRNTNPSGTFSYGNAWSNGPSALTPANNTGFPWLRSHSVSVAGRSTITRASLSSISTTASSSKMTTGSPQNLP